MAWLGLSPRRLTQEIEDVQNPAVGAVFFIVSLTVSLFIGMFVTAGFTPVRSASVEVAPGYAVDAAALEATTQDYLVGAGWIIGAFVLAMVLTWINFYIAYRVMSPTPGENVVQYIRRELIVEQNVSLAFFLGGLAISPFIAVLFQTI
jgi:hypothetical protein